MSENVNILPNKCPWCKTNAEIDPLVGTGMPGSVYCPFCGMRGPEKLTVISAIKVWNLLTVTQENDHEINS